MRKSILFLFGNTCGANMGAYFASNASLSKSPASIIIFVPSGRMRKAQLPRPVLM